MFTRLSLFDMRKQGRREQVDNNWRDLNGLAKSNLFMSSMSIWEFVHGTDSSVYWIVVTRFDWGFDSVSKVDSSSFLSRPQRSCAHNCSKQSDLMNFVRPSWWKVVISPSSIFHYYIERRLGNCQQGKNEDDENDVWNYLVLLAVFNEEWILCSVRSMLGLPSFLFLLPKTSWMAGNERSWRNIGIISLSTPKEPWRHANEFSNKPDKRIH